MVVLWSTSDLGLDEKHTQKFSKDYFQKIKTTITAMIDVYIFSLKPRGIAYLLCPPIFSHYLPFKAELSTMAGLNSALHGISL